MSILRTVTPIVISSNTDRLITYQSAICLFVYPIFFEDILFKFAKLFVDAKIYRNHFNLFDYTHDSFLFHWLIHSSIQPNVESGSSRPIITQTERHLFLLDGGTFSYFPPLEHLWYRYLRNSSPMVLRDIERLNRDALFGAIFAKSRALSDERFIVLF